MKFVAKTCTDYLTAGSLMLAHLMATCPDIVSYVAIRLLGSHRPERRNNVRFSAATALVSEWGASAIDTDPDFR